MKAASLWNDDNTPTIAVIWYERHAILEIEVRVGSIPTVGTITKDNYDE